MNTRYKHLPQGNEIKFRIFRREKNVFYLFTVIIVPIILYIYISSKIKFYHISAEPQIPQINIENDAERIQKRNHDVQKKFEKRFWIRKHGCQYLSLITDLMGANQNYGKRTIDEEFQILLDLHTGHL